MAHRLRPSSHLWSPDGTTTPGLRTRPRRAEPRMLERGRDAALLRNNASVMETARRTYSPQTTSRRNACPECSLQLTLDAEAQTVLSSQFRGRVHVDTAEGI